MVEKQIITKPEEIKRVIPLAEGRQIALTRPLVMGILNLTPDSFSDGGRHESPEAGLKHALEMVADGADIIDVGGESSRPGASPVQPEEELRRVIPTIEKIREKTDVCLSIDTYRAETAAAALDAGADIVNDISALRWDEKMAALVGERKAPVVLMHMKGRPGDMQDSPSYEDCPGEISEFFAERIQYATDAGIDKGKLILDPGIGFGKRLSDNLDILRNLSRFRELGLPLLIGTSRKAFIGMLTPGESAVSERLGGSVAAAVASVMNGADIVRVHDVAPTVEALRVIQGIRSVR
jgi:dihydropteroate synthase